MQSNYAIQLKNITKRFPGVIANDQISINVCDSEIRAILGENGAGKTTLMKVLDGLYQPDEGEIILWGKAAKLNSPQDAINQGIGMVHQHFMLFPSMSVVENIIFGSEPTKFGLVDIKKAAEKIDSLSKENGLDIDMYAKVHSLPVGIRQRIEILKALYREAKILILDEPTAVLTPKESEGLFNIIKKMAKEGKTIIFITHKLNEVMAVADTATVLRDGKVVANLEIKDTNAREITRHMIGRDSFLEIDKSNQKLGEELLLVKNLVVENDKGKEVVDNISFSVEKGSIVGIAGVAGNGQVELVESLVGLRRAKSGEIKLCNEDITNLKLSKRREKGLVYIPEDRILTGTAIEAKVNENLIMGHHRQTKIANSKILRKSEIRSFSNSLIEEFNIKVSNQQEPSFNLSGGNLQKLVVAREFSQNSRLLIAEQPTRGVDIGSAEFIHNQIVSYTNQTGGSVLLISSDLNEIMALSDKILVLFEGKIVGQLVGEDITLSTIGLLMAGALNNEQH